MLYIINAMLQDGERNDVDHGKRRRTSIVEREVTKISKDPGFGPKWKSKLLEHREDVNIWV